MSFLKRTTFTDKLDEEIYIFNLGLNLVENCLGKFDVMNEVYFDFYSKNKKGLLYIDPGCGYLGIGFIIDNKGYEWLEFGSKEVNDLINIWLPDRKAINRDPTSKIRYEFSITDGNTFEETAQDTLLDSFLLGGVNRIPEDFYFQESLVRTSHMYEYKDIDRILDALKVKTDLVGCLFQKTLDGYTVQDYHDLYDFIMGKV